MRTLIALVFTALVLSTTITALRAAIVVSRAGPVGFPDRWVKPLAQRRYT